MNIAIDVITWLGGNCCVPSACRSRPITTMMRTKLVVISRIAGARLTTVSSSITWMLELIPSGLVHCCGPPRPLSACGSSDGPAAVCAVGVRGAESQAEA